MKKHFIAIFIIGIMLMSISASASTYTVVSGDSLWKIAVKTQTGLSEMIGANPQIENPALIYPGEKITIPAKDPTTTSYQAEVTRIVNAERAKAGLKALTVNWELQRVAQTKAKDMTDKHYFSHTSPTYGSPFAMMKSFGIHYTSAGENIAQGQRTPQAVMTAWMNSSGHRANILNSSYTQIGVGYDSRSSTWVQEFIRP